MSAAASEDGTARRRHPRADAGTVRPTERDLLGLSWVTEMYGVQMDVLQRVTGATAGALSNVVGRWKRAGWAEVSQLGSGPRWVWATDAGIEMAGRYPYAARRPSAGMLAHHRAVALQRRWIETGDALPGQQVEWISERALRYELGRSKGSDAVREHVVDAVVRISDLNRPVQVPEYAVEVELTAKPYAAVLNNMRSGATKYHAVRWFVAPAVRPLVDRAYAELCSQDAQRSPESRFGPRIRIEEVWDL